MLLHAPHVGAVELVAPALEQLAADRVAALGKLLRRDVLALDQPHDGQRVAARLQHAADAAYRQLESRALDRRAGADLRKRRAARDQLARADGQPRGLGRRLEVLAGLQAPGRPVRRRARLLERLAAPDVARHVLAHLVQRRYGRLLQLDDGDERRPGRRLDRAGHLTLLHLERLGRHLRREAETEDRLAAPDESGFLELEAA